MSYSLKDIAKLYGRPYPTTARHIQQLKRKKKFKKKSPGVYYNKNEVQELLTLLGTDIKI